MDWMRLVKLPLCVLVACSALWGYVLHSPRCDWPMLVLFCGVLLLACGAAGLNSVQEREIDRLYARTQNRPLAAGRLPVHRALIGSLLLTGAGLLLLMAAGSSLLPFWLGLAAVLLYNLCYTPLKQHSIFALLPGGIAGAMPTLMGWTAASGGSLNLQAWLLFTLLFLWQIPHYLLVVLIHYQDYIQGKHPSLIRLMPVVRIRQITAIWIFSSLVVALLLARLSSPPSAGAQAAFLPMLIGMAFCGLLLVFRQNRIGPTPLYLTFNLSFFGSLISLIVLKLTAG